MDARSGRGPAAAQAATLRALRARPLPDWFRDAKLGIFVHWGPASVPGFAPPGRSMPEVLREDPGNLALQLPYADWYANAIRFPESPSARFHRQHFQGAPYQDFGPAFERGLEAWQPDAWADLFSSAGARYVVLVTKHHDGFCLWPSAVPHPQRPGWACRRDVVQELAAAVRARGMRFGVYYSGGLDWTFPSDPVRTPSEIVASVIDDPAYAALAEAHLRELIERVSPSVLWNDIAWPGQPERLFRLFEDYYQAVPEGVVNDRWHTPGRLHRALRWRPLRLAADAALRMRLRRGDMPFVAPPPPHWDFRTPEYAAFPELKPEAWETTRGLGNSFGYNRAEDDGDLIQPAALLHHLIDVVAKNGNLLLNVGPRGEDAAIPEIQQTRLRAMGEWLAVNGAAIHESRPWSRAVGETRGGLPVRFTTRDGVLHAIVLGTPTGTSLGLCNVHIAAETRVHRLGDGPALRCSWVQEGPDLRIQLRSPLPPSAAHVFALSPAPAG